MRGCSCAVADRNSVHTDEHCDGGRHILERLGHCDDVDRARRERNPDCPDRRRSGCQSNAVSAARRALGESDVAPFTDADGYADTVPDCHADHGTGVDPDGHSDGNADAG